MTREEVIEKVEEQIDNAPQYHFERDLFCNMFETVLRILRQLYVKYKTIRIHNKCKKCSVTTSAFCKNIPMYCYEAYD